MRRDDDFGVDVEATGAACGERFLGGAGRGGAAAARAGWKPTALERATLWTASNSRASSACFSVRTALRRRAKCSRWRGRWSWGAESRAWRAAVTRASSFVAASMLAEYTSRLPQDSHTDGCVFQGERGCTLPIELRADKCNAYFCPPFKHAQERHTELGATQAVLVAFDNKVATSERAYRLGDDGLPLVLERTQS
jgi:hypothetical protein